MKLTARAAVVALFVAILVAGCGGGGDDETAGASDSGPITTSSLSAAEYRKEAIAICLRVEDEEFEKSTAYAAQHPEESLVERLSGAFEEVYLPAMESRAAGLRKLGAPPGDEKQVEEIIVAYESAIDAARKEGPESAAFGDKSLRARTLARKYKIGECVV